jgi:23S rRNA (pseudouridine1915-N3)-methyltransferase
MRIKICWVGKTQNAPIKILLSDYLARIKHLAPMETIEVPDLSRRRGLRGAALVAAEGREIERALGTQGLRVVLDENGAQLSSPEFARWLAAQQLRGAREIAFIIGGPDGIDASLSRDAGLKLSLGKMTWTHEMVRVLLAEQVYRALSILRNIPYHK